MATHSSILPWRIPWTGKPGRFQSMGSQSWTQLNWLSTHAHKSSFCRFHTLHVQVTKSIMLLLSSFSALQGIEDTSNSIKLVGMNRNMYFYILPSWHNMISWKQHWGSFHDPLQQSLQVCNKNPATLVQGSRHWPGIQGHREEWPWVPWEYQVPLEDQARWHLFSPGTAHRPQALQWNSMVKVVYALASLHGPPPSSHFREWCPETVWPETHSQARSLNAPSVCSSLFTSQEAALSLPPHGHLLGKESVFPSIPRMVWWMTRGDSLLGCDMWHQALEMLNWGWRQGNQARSQAGGGGSATQINSLPQDFS